MQWNPVCRNNLSDFIKPDIKVFLYLNPITKMETEYTYLFKILIVGDSGVGKSCMLLRYVEDTYCSASIPTIGVDFRMKNIDVDGKIAKMQIWDTAGQERFRTITSSYYRGAHAVIIAFDLTNMKSFENVQKWLDEVGTYCEKSVKILVGTKCDRVSELAVSRDQINDFAHEKNMIYYETSAKSDINLSTVFEDTARKILEDNGSFRIKPTNVVNVKPAVSFGTKDKCNC